MLSVFSVGKKEGLLCYARGRSQSVLAGVSSAGQPLEIRGREIHLSKHAKRQAHVVCYEKGPSVISFLQNPPSPTARESGARIVYKGKVGKKWIHTTRTLILIYTMLTLLCDGI